MCRYHEHGFEAVHKQLQIFETRYCIPSAAVKVDKNSGEVEPPPGTIDTVADRRITRSQSIALSQPSDASAASAPNATSSQLSSSQTQPDDEAFAPPQKTKRLGVKQRLRAKQLKARKSELRKKLLASSPYEKQRRAEENQNLLPKKQEMNERGRRDLTHLVHSMPGNSQLIVLIIFDTAARL